MTTTTELVEDQRQDCFTEYWIELTKCVGEGNMGGESQKQTCAGALPMALPFSFVTDYKAPGGCRKSGSLLTYTARCCGNEIHQSGVRDLAKCVEAPRCGFTFTATGWLVLIGGILLIIVACTSCCWFLCCRKPKIRLKASDDEEESGVELPSVEFEPQKSWIRRTIPHWGIKRSLVFKRDAPVEALSSSLLEKQEASEAKDVEAELSVVAEISDTQPEAVEPEPPAPEPEEEEEVIYGRSLEEEVTKWLERLSDEPRDDQEFGEWLKDGQILCKVANNVQPGSIKKINTQNMPFKKMENITNFIGACRKLGVLEKDLFSTVDLYEEKNLKGVQNCIYNFASIIRDTAPEFKGPYLGVRQKAQVKDVGRDKQNVDLSVGLRKDVHHEVRDANKSAAGVRIAGTPG